MLPGFYSTGKWYTSIEQPHDEMHLAIGGQDHQPTKMATAKLYDKNSDHTKEGTISSVGSSAGMLWFVISYIYRMSTSSGLFDVSRYASTLTCCAYSTYICSCCGLVEDGSDVGRHRAGIDDRSVRIS